MTKIELDYYYFFFEPFSYREMVNALGNKLPVGNRDDAYKEWIKWYQFHARLFYYDQYWQHNNQLYERFSKAHNLPDDDGYTLANNPDLNHLIKLLQYELGVTAHYEQFQKFMNYVESLNHTNDTDKVSDEDPLEWLNSYQPSYNHIITEAWFNIRINNTADEIKTLRAMSYKDEYLKTPHWFKVRALTIFIYRASCCTTECRGWGDQMWILYAPHRQVHHISYANRGNERFGDVCVVCKECHSKIHNGQKDIIDKSSTYVLF